MSPPYYIRKFLLKTIDLFLCNHFRLQFYHSKNKLSSIFYKKLKIFFIKFVEYCRNLSIWPKNTNNMLGDAVCKVEKRRGIFIYLSFLHSRLVYMNISVLVDYLSLVSILFFKIWKYQGNKKEIWGSISLLVRIDVKSILFFDFFILLLCLETLQSLLTLHYYNL